MTPYKCYREHQKTNKKHKLHLYYLSSSRRINKLFDSNFSAIWCGTLGSTTSQRADQIKALSILLQCAQLWAPCAGWAVYTHRLSGVHIQADQYVHTSWPVCTCRLPDVYTQVAWYLHAGFMGCTCILPGVYMQASWCVHAGCPVCTQAAWCTCRLPSVYM